MRRLLSVLLIATAFLAQPALAKSRIKDIVEFEGVRENQLVGYGIVVGLNGTGDALRNAPFTKQTLEAMMERLGVNVRETNLNTKNVAAVMVTAKLPPFAAPGAQIDVNVSALGDAKSLLGGTLLVTPLLGADGQAYAAAQGTVQTGSVSAGGASGSSITKGVPTAGRIAGGATVEKEIGFQLASMDQMRMTLRNPDFTTARRIADAVNGAYPGAASAENPTIVTLRPPAGQNMVAFLAQVENLPVEPDSAAKVVIDEVAGVIVMGDAVRVSTVAIQQGNLTITVREQPAVSQPAPFSRGGQTTVIPQSDLSVDEEKGKQFLTLRTGTSLSTLVQGLNALGVTPRDMISILQTIKAAGALQAEIEVM
ncbi:flagellar basal body P-ring protein FlgI [Phenylobacterium sp.]|uniref:flagellar basal body P-ring protein FlgI n=1 Tax=Phenylobacterium sp. TaxID=1871053 RepID=UPI0025D9353B|nr:flagellar basal body P-ring protein FlgI [Phenylobacterium sp.]MBX3485926.1 flagellar basal body P-ring protein FlgI [Phenylobacterium sp.]MCW5760717.1 flagellar basal body P-ring protein FlgI [Phenylobacterium sp.]